MEIPLKTIIAILLVLCFTGTCSCGVFPQVPSSSVTSTSVPSEKSGLTVTTAPTPIPTYASGTELYGMLSVTGDVLIEPKYEYLDLFSEEGLARFEDHGLWGFLNAHGEEVIPAQYEDANNFSEGLAAVKVDGRYGFIDTTGEMVIEPRFEGVEHGFRYGRCVITLNDLQGLVDLDGKVIVEPKYSSIAFPCRDYIMVMEGEDRYGVIDQDGNVVLDMQNSVVGNVDENGYIFFFIEKNTDECVSFEKITDTSGQVEYSVRDQDVIFFSDYIYTPYICASTNNDTSMGVFDLTTGQFVTEEIYTNLWFEGDASEYTFARKETRVGVLDSASGKPILEIKYQWVDYSPDGQFSAFTDEQSCIVFDYSGKYVFETEKGNLLYAYLDQFNCWLYSNNRDQYGLINMQGEIVFSIEFEFSWLHDKAPSAKEYTPFMLLDYRPGGATPYVTEAENCYSFIGNDYSLVKRGPYTELIGYAGQSGILIGIDEAQHSEVLDVRGTLLFSSDKPIEFVTGNAEYFVYRQAID